MNNCFAVLFNFFLPFYFYLQSRNRHSEACSTYLMSFSFSAPPGHRFEDVPGVRRHLVRKSTKGQIVHIGKDHKEPSTRARKQDRTPHEVRHYTFRVLMNSQ